MATLIPRNTVHLTKGYNACVTSYGLHKCEYSFDVQTIKKPSIAKLRKGTGGRNSFNGILCTVFGSTGFIARVVCSRLGQIGTQLLLPYRGDKYHVLPMKLCGDLGQILFQPFHLRDEQSIAKCVKYSNVVINLIGQHNETRNFNYEDVHIDGAATIARVCRENGVERFIHYSNLTACENPEPRLLSSSSRLLKSKWLGECAVREEFPDATIVRSADVFGELDYFLHYYTGTASMLRYMSNMLPLWRLGELTIKQPVFCEDVGDGMAALVTDPSTKGKTYQFVGPHRYFLSDLTDWFNACLNGQEYAKHIRVPLEWCIPYKMFVSVYQNNPMARHLAKINWEALEMEHHTDEVKPDLPTLEDLGITPTPMEEIVPFIVKSAAVKSLNVRGYTHVCPVPPPILPKDFTVDFETMISDLLLEEKKSSAVMKTEFYHK